MRESPSRTKAAGRRFEGEMKRELSRSSGDDWDEDECARKRELPVVCSGMRRGRLGAISRKGGVVLVGDV